MEEDLKCEIQLGECEKYDLTFKILVIGSAGVGKSCLAIQATKNLFLPQYNSTIGFEFSNLNFKINNQIVNLQIWDTCGQEIYRSLVSSFYRNSSLAIIVYSVDSFDSFDQIENYYKDLRQSSNPDIKIFIIGNKADLDERRVVKKEEGMLLKERLGLDYFEETSAKTGYNIHKIFSEAAKTLFKEYLYYKDNGLTEPTMTRTNSFSLTKLNFSSSNRIGKGNMKKNCCE